MTINQKWLEMLSDEERAGVMKVEIAESAKTERTRIEQTQDTIRKRENADGYYVIRGCFAVALAFAALVSGITYYNVQALHYPQPAQVQTSSQR